MVLDRMSIFAAPEGSAARRRWATAGRVVMAAAVADFRPDVVATSKIKKPDEPMEMSLKLTQTVDVLAEFIREKGYSNFYIELGGEVYVSGLNRENQKWKIGIDTPESSSKERSISEVLSISNEAVATSGNYRKFYEVKGKKYAHTIDPKTGLQVTHNLLSATVIAKDCTTADGFATAFMVMGKEKTMAFLKQNRDLGLTVYLIYNEKGRMKSYASDSSKLFSL